MRCDIIEFCVNNDELIMKQDEILRQAVVTQNGKNWKLIAKYLAGKTEVQCLHRWTKVLNPNLTKGPWTEEVNMWCDNSVVC